MDTQQTYTPADIARELGLSKMTIRNWTTRYAAHLSPTAAPQPGAQRRFTPRDRAVIAYVAQLVNDGHRHEYIAQRISETTFTDDEVPEQPTPEPAHAATDEPHAALQPAGMVDTTAIMQAAFLRSADHDARIGKLEAQNRWIVALVAGFIAGATLMGILAVLVAMR